MTCITCHSFKDAKNTGGGRMMIVVRDVEKLCATLDLQGLALGNTIGGDFERIAQLSDADGNLSTFAEPPKISTKVQGKA